MSNLGIAVLTLLLWPAALLPALNTQQSTTTLYSLNKYEGKRGKDVERLTFCLNFQARGSCDLWYGSLYVGEDHDWFEISAAQSNRSVIKDLGLKTWEEPFNIPVVNPLPKLKPGEERVIGVDASGADGADGAPGAPGRPGADADGVVRERPATQPAATTVTRDPSRPKRDGKPKVDPIYVKAIVGHMYVIHVVDDTKDFYVLFRVEGIERGDNCTISWRLIDAPQPSAGNEQR
jgi:hypothetical protein